LVVKDRVGRRFVIAKLPHLGAGTAGFGTFAITFGRSECTGIGTQTSAQTGHAPTMTRIERKEPGIEIGKTRGADRACPPRR
jgi:hypothetical protein